MSDHSLSCSAIDQHHSGPCPSVTLKIGVLGKWLRVVWWSSSGTWEKRQIQAFFCMAWRITWLGCEMSGIVWYFEHSLVLPFLGIGVKTDLFQSCGHCWVFQISWHIECSTFTTSSFRIWNISTGIPSPPKALLVVMLSKVHLTSHSTNSDPRCVITPSWLSGSLIIL